MFIAVYGNGDIATPYFGTMCVAVMDICDLDPEVVESWLENMDLKERVSIEDLAFYELKNPVTFEKHVSYTLNQD